jgi:subtilisin family serine protease
MLRSPRRPAIRRARPAFHALGGPRDRARLAGLAILALTAIAPLPAHAAPGAPRAAAWPRTLSPELLLRLDPALVPFALLEDDSASIWVEFADKSPAGPLGEAESLGVWWSRLSPRNQARRIRARVWPRVDTSDLPVAPAYLDGLRGGGWRPFAVSRWLNRAAVRVRPQDLERLATLPYVARLSPVLRTVGIGDRAAGPEVHSALVGGPSARTSLTPVPSSQSGFAHRQLEQIGVTALHDAGFTGDGVVVALLDEGFNFVDKHEALRDRFTPPGYVRDFVEGDTVVSDTNNIALFDHGTWTLGCLAGYRPGVYLGSGYGATVALARTELDGSESPVEMFYWAQGAEWADSLGADVISSSVGYNRFDDISQNLPPSAFDGHTSEISRAAEIAASRGILVVNAAGNGHGLSPELVAPADVDGDSLIAVGAVDSFGTVAGFSSRGPTADGRIKPDLLARGVNAWLVSASGSPNSYVRNDGTSFSAPLIAGLAACLIQAQPGWTPVEVIRALRETASGACAPDNQHGWGIPNGAAARSWTPGPAAPTPRPQGFLQLALQGANPFQPGRTHMSVRFGLGPRLERAESSRLRVMDAEGRLVRNLFLGPLCCGRWLVADWDGQDFHGRAARSGVYFVQFDAEGRQSTLRIVLLR